jgi:long-chain fatty acid transport protein
MSIIFSGKLQAGGLYINEFATPSLGTAGAGAQAWGDNASTAFYNSAGMTLLEGNQLMVGGALLSTDIKFDPDPSTPVIGSDGGQAGSPAPLLTAAYVHSLSDKWKLGLDLISVSAAVLEYDDNWTGRRQAIKSQVFTLTLHPSVAYRVNDMFSVAAGVGIFLGGLELEVAGLQPGSKVTIDGDDYDYSVNLSAMLELTDRTRLGATYWSQVDFNFSGDVTFEPRFFQTGIDTELTLPQWFKAGIYHELNDKFTLLGTIGWEQWSRLDNVNISTSSRSAALPRNWDDTWHFAGGLQYHLSDPWMLQFGLAYDTSPVDAEDRTADMPVDRQIRYAFGAQYKKSDRLSFSGAFEYVDLGDAKINNDNPVNGLIGKYKNNDMYVLALTVNWKF